MKLRLEKAVSLLLAAAVIAGCASPAPYGPKARGTGYTDQKLESNRWRVTFSGNSLTPRETVENYLLYRAAELTLANGYDHFVMVDQATQTDTTYRHSISAFGGFGTYWAPWGLGMGTGISTSTPEREYYAEAVILMYKGRKKSGDQKAFDAREVQTNLGPLVLRSET